MLDAVLFDWGDTLMRWAWEDELLEEGHRAGLEAVGRDPAAAPALAARFAERVLPSLVEEGILEEVEYPALVRDLLAGEGIDLGDGELDRYLEAEHRAWAPARLLGAHTHALLESLRARGLRLALVSNAVDPPWLLHRDLAELGVAERLDAAVFSSEVGLRKPHPAIFERALAAVDAAPERTVFVGDSLVNDVAGAARLGMTTVQALWFRADEERDGIEPDVRAFTQIDVLNAVRRLTGEA